MSLRKQAASLAIMHSADVLQPLLILPYAARVLGPLHFGQYAYAMSIGQLAATFVEYGFHWTAQRAAASSRRQPALLASLLAEVVATKTILCVLVIAVGLATADRVLAISRPMYLFTTLTCVGGILFPAWLFIALERAWQAALAIVVARILALGCFLLLVSSPDDVERAVAIQAAIPLVAGVVSLPFVLPIGFDGFRSLTPSRIQGQLTNGWRGFLYTLVDRALATLPIPLVEHFGGYVAAGQYSVAEKFVGATRPFFRVMSETFLPRVAYYADHDPAAGVALIRGSFFTLVIGAALSCFLFAGAPYLIIALFGVEFTGAIPIVRLMSVLPVLINANICTSNLYMFNFGHERAWTSLTVAGLLIFLAVTYLLSGRFADASHAVPVALIVRESVVFAVSGGFFIVFGTGAELKRDMQSAPAKKVSTAMHSSIARLLPKWRNQLRSEG